MSQVHARIHDGDGDGGGAGGEVPGLGGADGSQSVLVGPIRIVGDGLGGRDHVIGLGVDDPRAGFERGDGLDEAAGGDFEAADRQLSNAAAAGSAGRAQALFDRIDRGGRVQPDQHLVGDECAGRSRQRSGGSGNGGRCQEQEQGRQAEQAEGWGS